MTYNPEKQYRCTIIRGKAKNIIDDLLPAYAHILDSVCPCNVNNFAELFDKELKRIFPTATSKTLANHRTEMAGKLFGMYYYDGRGSIQVSERTKKLLKDNDQPAFFKDICYKFQFPNGMDKITKVMTDISNKTHIRQCAFLLEVIRIAYSKKFIISSLEAGYYILNSLDVLQGKVKPAEVVKIMMERRKTGIEKRVPAGSRGMQHIRETLNYLELANLIKIQAGNIILNKKETTSIDYIASSWHKQLLFNVTDYDLDTLKGRKEMYYNWQLYYSKLADIESSAFNTSLESLTENIEDLKSQGYAISEGFDTTILGDEGEFFVFGFEKNRVKVYNPRLINRVLLLGKTRGLGYDIQSVRADKSARSDHSIYIEVKATKRVTAPNPADKSWSDVIVLTRNEWVAADQHRDAYSLYRVYFTPKKVDVFVINDPVTKNEKGLITAMPDNYRVDFTLKAGEFLKIV